MASIAEMFDFATTGRCLADGGSRSSFGISLGWATFVDRDFAKIHG